MSDPIYLDHAATTPVRPEALEAMLPFLGDRFGNPSSTHRWGRTARVALDEARERVAACLGARADEIVFTSGGTEGDNWAVLGAWRGRRDPSRSAVAVSAVEHKGVLAAAHQAAREGAEERLLPVTAHGAVDLDAAAALLDARVAVCSVMWVNNETGVVQPIAAVAERARAVGAVVHSDGVQALGKVAVDVRAVPLDVLTVTGHKLGAPKGIGAQWVRRGVALAPLLVGGSQERDRRPGTENVAFAVAFATAAERAVAEREQEGARLTALRDRLEALLRARIPDVVVHGAGAERAPHVLHVSAPGVDGESLLMALDVAGIAASGGSACQSGSASPSHVLAAMGVAPDVAGAAVRFSFGKLSDPTHVERVAELLPSLVARARGAAEVWR